MLETTATPYADLTPELILDAIEANALPVDGHLLALNSYENRVYQVGIADADPIIAKFYRPGRWSDAAILEEHSFSEQLAADELPVVAPLRVGGRTLNAFAGYRFSLTPRVGGRPPELDGPNVLERLGRCIARLHNVGATTAFRQRPTLDIHSFGEAPRDFLLHKGCIPVDLEPAYRSVSEHALQGVSQCFQRAGEVQTLRLHGDCHVGNILWTDDAPLLVDFDDARTGPILQDLWMLLSGDRREMATQFCDILAGYEDFRAFNPRELHLLEALRTLRLIHYAAWIARRWDDPAFPLAFPWFDTQVYWQDRILELREQIAAMEEGPLAVF